MYSSGCGCGPVERCNARPAAGTDRAWDRARARAEEQASGPGTGTGALVHVISCLSSPDRGLSPESRPSFPPPENRPSFTPSRAGHPSTAPSPIPARPARKPDRATHPSCLQDRRFVERQGHLTHFCFPKPDRQSPKPGHGPATDGFRRPRDHPPTHHRMSARRLRPRARYLATPAHDPTGTNLPAGQT
jgi:hypothetical protein